MRGDGMKARIIVVISMLLISVSVCLISMLYVRSAMNEMEDMRIQTVLAVEEGRKEDALVLLTDMISLLDERSRILECLTPHEDLHNLVIELTTAKKSLMIGDMDDYKQSVMLIQEFSEHIRDHESLTLSNIL